MFPIARGIRKRQLWLHALQIRGRLSFTLRAVDFSMKDCWDCPIPLSDVLIYFAVMLVLIVTASAMQESRLQPIRATGFLLTALILFFAVVYTSVIPRWGISRGADVPLDVWPRRMSWIILGAFDLLLVAIVIFATRRRLAKA